MTAHIAGKSTRVVVDQKINAQPVSEPAKADRLEASPRWLPFKIGPPIFRTIVKAEKMATIRNAILASAISSVDDNVR